MRLSREPPKPKTSGGSLEGPANLRILLNLTPLAEHPYDNDYHYHVQGLLYSLMREAERNEVHDRIGYKYFCFSNLFPYRAMFLPGREDARLLISTPDAGLANGLKGALETRLKAGGDARVLKVGGMKFGIRSFEGPFSLSSEVQGGQPVRLRAATPVIVRIPKWRYPEYGIESERPYLYWRETIALEAFVKQLRDNMEKKIAQFKSVEAQAGHIRGLGGEKAGVSLPEVISYRFVKVVSKPITVKGERQQVIGSLWELEFVPQSSVEASNLEFAVESGFGERNSLGFGFMNMI